MRSTTKTDLSIYLKKWLRMLINFLNDVDTLFLEFRSSFGKYHPVFPKDPSNECLLH